MSQSAPLQWFMCLIIFPVILYSVMSKLWFYPVRPRFLFSTPNMPTVKKWNWASKV